MKRANITKVFMTGLATVLPIAVTAYILYWLASFTESILGQFIRIFLPDHFYYPGMGLLAGIVIVFLIGTLMNAWIVRKWFDWSERLLYRMPIVKSVYGSMREFFDFFSHPRDKEFLEVVFVRIGDTGIQLLGFVTQHYVHGIANGDSQDEDTVAVYLPLSYQIGGYTVVVPRSYIKPAAISAQEAWRFVLTAGVTGRLESSSPSIKHPFEP